MVGGQRHVPHKQRGWRRLRREDEPGDWRLSGTERLRLKPAGTGPGVLGHFPVGARTLGKLEVVLQENQAIPSGIDLGGSKSGQGSQEVSHLALGLDLQQQGPKTMRDVGKASKG